MGMSLDKQIANFESQQKGLVKAIMLEKNIKRQGSLKSTALFFKDVIDSLKELKMKRESSQNININIESLIKSVDIKEICHEELIEKISPAIDDIVNSTKIT